MLTVAEAEEVQKTNSEKLISNSAARAIVNRFTLQHLTDCFCAGQPRLVIVGANATWNVPILFAYPNQVFGETGDVLIDAVEGTILGFTPPQENYRNAKRFLSQ